jgi:hypothetical protein
MSQESKLCSLCVQESVECLVSQENHPGLAESTADVDLVAVVEDLDGDLEGGGCNLWTGHGECIIRDCIWLLHLGQTSKLGRCRSRKAHKNYYFQHKRPPKGRKRGAASVRHVRQGENSVFNTENQSKAQAPEFGSTLSF